MNVSKYATLVWDCDGVVLDSNRVKTEAFRRAAQPFGEEAAEALAGYHVMNGGISRYVKFAHFLEHIAAAPGSGNNMCGINELLRAFAEHVIRGLETCAVADGLDELRKATPQARWLIVSGGDQAELRQVFRKRGLADYFDGGIFGSPDAKMKILEREIEAENIRYPALFLGDSRYDHEVAERGGLDFVFVHQWTEFAGWKEYCYQAGIKAIALPRELLR